MTREMFAIKFIDSIREKYDQEIVNMIYGDLLSFVSDYDISERETSVAVVDGYIPVWMEDFFAYYICNGTKKATLKNYKTILQDFLLTVKIPVNEISTADCQKFLAYCLYQKNNCKRTVSHKRDVINNFFTWSVKHGHIDKNPMEEVPTISYPRTTRVPYTDMEIAQIKSEIKDVRDKAIIEVLISTACRIEELSNMKRSHVNFEENEIFIPCGKGDKARTVYLLPEASYALKKYLETRTDSSDYLFVGKRRNSKTGKYDKITTGALEKMLKLFGNKIGIAAIQPHRFRRYTATRWKRKGMSIDAISMMLGHSNTKTTQIYLYLDTSDSKKEFMQFA